MTGCFALIVAAAGWFSVTTGTDGVSTLVKPDGSPTYLVGAEHLFKQQPHEFANTNWENEVVQNLKSWNFNFLGAGPIPELRKKGVPYSVIAWMSEGMTLSEDPDDFIFPMKGVHVPCTGFPNVFSPKWPQSAAEMAKTAAASVKDDPNFVGYDIDNELKFWGAGAFGNDTNGLFYAVAALPETHSAHRALADFVQARQTTIADAPEAVRRAFVAEICERFFRVATEALRREDPNHLILGVRFPGLGGPREAWVAAGKYCDIVSFNVYPWVDLDANWVKSGCDYWGGTDLRTLVEARHADCGRPMMVTEWGTSAIDSGLPCLRAVGQRFRTQAERTRAAAAMMGEFASWPFIVGVSWFRYRDNVPNRGGNFEDCNWGLVDLNGRPYPELTAMFTRLNKSILDIHCMGLRLKRRDPGDRGFPRVDAARAKLATGAKESVVGTVGESGVLASTVWDGRELGAVSLAFTWRTPEGGLRWTFADRVAGSFRESDGALVVTNEAHTAGFAVQVVTRWRFDGLENAFMGEVVAVVNQSDAKATIESVSFRHAPPFAADAKPQNEKWGQTILWKPLRAAGWVAPDGVWTGVLSAAPLADYFGASYDAQARYAHELARFRFTTVDARTPLELAPGAAWRSNGRIWAVFAAGKGGQSGWLAYRDRFESLFFPALGRLAVNFPFTTRAGEMRLAKGHIQGIAATDSFFFLSTAYSLAKVGWDGRVVKEVAVPPHVGDICFDGERLYVTFASWAKGVLPRIDVYDTNLKKLDSHDFDVDGLDGICRVGDDLLVGWGSGGEAAHLTNRIARIDRKTFAVKEVKEFAYDNPMHWGIQNLTTDGTNIYATVYPADAARLGVVVFDKGLNLVESLPFEAGHGFDVAPARFADGKSAFFKVFTDYDWQKSGEPDFDPKTVKVKLRLYERDGATMRHLEKTF